MGYRASTLLNPGPDKYLPVVPTLRHGFFSAGIVLAWKLRSATPAATGAVEIQICIDAPEPRAGQASPGCADPSPWILFRGDCFGLEITKRNASGNRRGRDSHPTMLPPTGLLNSSTARIPVDPMNATELGIE